MKRTVLIGFMAIGLILAGAIGSGALIKSFASDDVGKRQQTLESSNGEFISIEEAKKFALVEVNGQVKKVEMEKEHGTTFYEVYINAQGVEHEVYVNALSGVITKVEIDDDDDDDVSQNPDSAKKITIEEARKIAKGHVDGVVKEIELDDNSIYEVELKTASGETKVEVDAYTGKILKVDHEDDDDDDDDDQKD